MKRLLIVLVVLVAGVALVGFSRGWFHVSSDRNADTSGVTLTVDKDKVREDKDKVVDKAQGVGRDATRDKGAAAPAGTH
jgi:hypothetical protein